MNEADVAGDMSIAGEMEIKSIDPTHHARAERTRRLKRTFVTSLFFRPLAAVIPFVTAPLFFKYLGGKERYGLFETIISMSVYLGMTNAGLALGVVNKLTDCNVSGDRDLARRYVSSLFFALIGIAIVLGLAISIVIPFVDWRTLLNIKSALAIRETPWTLWVTAILTLVGLLAAVPSAVYMAYQDLEINNYWDGASKILTLIASIAIVRTRFGLIGIGAAVIGVPALVRIVNSFVLLVYEKSWLRPSLRLFDRSLLRAAMSQGISLFILQLSVVALFQSDKILITMLIGPEEASGYSLVGRLFLSGYGVFLLFLTPLWPAFGEAIRRHDLAWVKRCMRISLVTACGGMLLCGIILYFASGVIFRTWMHHKIDVSRSLILAMTAMFVMRAWVDCRATVLNPANVLWPQVVFFVAHAALNLMAAIFMSRRWGVEGIAWATPLTALLTTAWGYPLMTRKFFRTAEANAPMKTGASGSSGPGGPV